jgi:hypothetical protein
MGSFPDPAGATDRGSSTSPAHIDHWPGLRRSGPGRALSSVRSVERPPAHGAHISPRPRFPRGVQHELTDRRVRLLAALDGDVLDLSQPAARTEVLAAAAAPLVESRYGTIVSVAELVRFPDLVHALTGVDRLLAPDGELILVEPVHHPGGAATLFATMWAVHPAVARVHVERDVSLAVRSIGLSLTDVERFTMPTVVWPLRLFVHARARHIVEQVAA